MAPSPDTLITPMPPSPWAVLIAAMVELVFIFLPTKKERNDPLLNYLILP